MSQRIQNASQIRQVMTRIPEVVSPDAALNDAWGRMRREGFRHLPVVMDGKLVGLLSDRSIRLAAAYEGSARMKVADAMVSEPFVVSPEAPIFEVCAQMATQRIGSVVIVDSGRSPLGIFTAQDALLILSDILRELQTPAEKAA
jgi:acetoin utilization protein AcuB